MYMVYTYGISIVHTHMYKHTHIHTHRGYNPLSRGTDTV